MAKPARTKNRDNARRSKKKVSILNQDRVDYIDWKDVNLLRRFMSDRAKIRARRVTGNDAQQQKEIARAIKNAREMALLPYANRITQTRGQRRGDGDRADRGDRRPPRDDTASTETELVTDETMVDEVQPDVDVDVDVDADAIAAAADATTEEA
jgi:small subunit ribosomal protein S18